MSEAEAKLGSVVGFGSTGSSAYVDLLAEYDGVKVVPGEFRLLQDPDGLLDICSALSENWSWLRPDAEVRRFLQFSSAQADRHDRTLVRCLLKLPTHGEYADDIRAAAELFVNEILLASSLGYWHFHDTELSAARNFFERLKWGGSVLGLYSKERARALRHLSPLYFVRPDADVWEAGRKAFSRALWEHLPAPVVVLDQGIMPYNRNSYRRIVGNMRVIIVFRDPRDVYLDSRTYNAYPNDVHTFIEWYRASVEKSLYEPRLATDYFVQFENLVRNYSSAKAHLEAFWDGRLGTHSRALSRFDPKESSQNTAMWKRCSSHMTSDLELIANELRPYCVEEDEVECEALQDIKNG